MSDSAPSSDNTANTKPYFNQDDGLYTTDNEGNIKQICSPLDVVALTRNNDNESWGRQLELVDPDGIIKEISIPMTSVTSQSGTCISRLADLGLRLADQKTGTKQALIDYITNAETSNRVQCVPRPGWHGDIFILPYRSFAGIGEGTQKVTLQGFGPIKSRFGKKATLEDWQYNIGQYLSGNSRLLLCVSAAFAAPLLSVLGESESGGFNFFGGSSVGKTTALQVAGSVWGGGGRNGFLQPWRTTDNGLEYVAEAHCDALLCLDEIGQVSSRKIGEIAYMLANGEGKIRASKDGGNSRKPEWRLLFLSSGEMTLADKMAEGGMMVRAGQETRLIDIPADAGKGMGILEELHGHPDAGALAYHLKFQSQSNYGTPSEAFLECLTRDVQQDRNDLASRIDSYRGEFLASYDLNDADGQVERVARRFSLAAAAGELAIEYGILPCSKGEAIRASARCFQDWLDHRGGSGSGEEVKILSQVKHFLETNQSSRFQREDPTDNFKINNMAGYIKTFGSGDHKDRTVYAIQTEVFTKEVCKGFNIKAVCSILMKHGFLLPESDARLNKQIRFSKKNVRCYCIFEDIICESTQDTHDDLDDGDF